MVTGRDAFVFSRVELRNDVIFAILHMPDEGARLSFSGKDSGIRLARVVDTELYRDVESKGTPGRRSARRLSRRCCRLYQR